ncbi:MAG: hypothetical protein Q9183_006509, partial [Haloplaca sp. 2 TL-2023]
PAVASDGEEADSNPFPESRAATKDFNISDDSDSTFSDTQKKKTKKTKQAIAKNTDVTPPCEPIPENDDPSNRPSSRARTKKKGNKAAAAERYASPPPRRRPSCSSSDYDWNPPVKMNCRNCPSVDLIEEGRFCTYCGNRALMLKACWSCARSCGTSARGKSGKCTYCGKEIEPRVVIDSD